MLRKKSFLFTDFILPESVSSFLLFVSSFLSLKCIVNTCLINDLYEGFLKSLLIVSPFKLDQLLVNCIGEHNACWSGQWSRTGRLVAGCWFTCQSRGVFSSIAVPVVLPASFITPSYPSPLLHTSAMDVSPIVLYPPSEPVAIHI